MEPGAALAVGRRVAVLCRGERGGEAVLCHGEGGGALTTSEASGRTAEESCRTAGPWGRGESAAPTNPSAEEKRKGPGGRS